MSLRSQSWFVLGGRARTGEHPRHDEAGQITVLAAIVLALGLIAAATVAIGARVLIERAAASSAADSIALASVVDPLAADRLAAELGVDATRVDSGQVTVRIGDATASAHAVADPSIDVAPVLVAVLARAEQLLGVELARVWVDATTVRIADNADGFAAIAPSLGLCPDAERTFVLC